MKITVDSLGSSSGDEENRLLDIDGKGEDSDVDVDMIGIELEEREGGELEGTATTNSEVNWTGGYTNGRGGAASVRASRGGNRMRGGLGGDDGRGRGTDLEADQGYHGPFSVTTNLSSESSSSGHEDQNGLAGNKGQNGDDQEINLKETLIQLAANINSGFVYVNTAMEQLKQGQLELYDAKFTLERLCWRNGIYPEFPSATVMGEATVSISSGEGRVGINGGEGHGGISSGEGRGGRGGVSARARKWYPRMTTGGKTAKPQKIASQVKYSSYNSQRAKEGLPKLIKRLASSKDKVKGPKRSKKFMAIVLHDIGNRIEDVVKATEGIFEKDAMKMEGDAAAAAAAAPKIAEFDDNQEDEDFRPVRKKRKEDLPLWRSLRVDVEVMERIMKRVDEDTSSSESNQSPSTQSQSQSANEGAGASEDKKKEEKKGEEK